MTAADTNLPVELTSFIGRDEELAEVERLVRARRLVRGTGKASASESLMTCRNFNNDSGTGCEINPGTSPSSVPFPGPVVSGIGVSLAEFD